MKQRRVLAVVVTVAATLVPVAVSAPAADAARCLSGADVRQHVSAFVHSLRDDISSAHIRGHVHDALVQTVKAARGAKADTPKENRGLGSQISALARTLTDAPDLVTRKAIIAEIHALQDQKKAGDTTTTDVQVLKHDVRALGRAIGKRTDTAAEGRQVSAWVHTFMAQFSC